MKLVPKIVASIVVVAVLTAMVLYAGVYFGAERPARPVGFERLMVRDPRDRPLEVGIWYPTDTSPGMSIIGLSAQSVAANGTVSGHNLPLIVMSHGSGGLFGEHADTALALASAGFVVAAVTHTGDNNQDQSYVGTSRWLVDRARHIHLVIEYMLSEWPARQQLDGRRIGIFGYSAGGVTALVSIGGMPEVERIGPHCRAHPEFVCKFFNRPLPPVSATTWVHDPRIRAAVLVGPGLGYAFEPDGLSHVTASVQLWNGSNDHWVPYGTNAAIFRRLLPTPPEYHLVPGATHLSFLAPCPSWLLPTICRDPNGFDRRAVHRDMNQSVIAFFRKHLVEKNSSQMK